MPTGKECQPAPRFGASPHLAGLYLKDPPPNKKVRCAMDFCVIFFLPTFLITRSQGVKNVKNKFCRGVVRTELAQPGSLWEFRALPQGAMRVWCARLELHNLLSQEVATLFGLGERCACNVSSEQVLFSRRLRLGSSWISQNTAQACAKPSKTSKKFGLKN
jgi:hypothetical protein